MQFGSVWSASGTKLRCDGDRCMDLTTMDMDKEEEEGEIIMNLEEGEIIDLDKGEAEERDHAEAEEDNLSDFWYDEDKYDKEMDKRKQYDEETDFEWYQSEQHAQLLAAVKERERQRSLLKETQTKLTITEEEKHYLVKERDEAAARYRSLVEQLEQRLKCPVCLTVPREAPVITCKEGHLACSSCLQGWLAGGRLGCPYCRADHLVGAKSLLADLVIKNIEHECNLNGCGQRVPYDDLADHQKKCQFRLVKCPGSNLLCNMMLPFCQVVDHVQKCSDTVYRGQNDGYQFQFPEDCLERGFIWDTVVIHKHMLGTFFVRVEKNTSQFTVEVVMKGTEEDCEKVNAEIAIKDANSGKSTFSCSHHPRPMGKENTKEFCLSVTQAALAKIWSHDKDLNMIVFIVDVKITLA